MSDTTAAVAAAVAAQTPTGDGGGTAAQAYLEVYQTALAQLHDTGAEEEDEGEDEEARAAYDKLTNEQLKQLLDEKEKDLRLAAEIGQALLAKYDNAVQDADREIEGLAEQIEEKERETYDLLERVARLEVENHSIVEMRNKAQNDAKTLHRKLDDALELSMKIEKEKEELAVTVQQQKASIDKINRDLNVTKQRSTNQEENTWEQRNKIHGLEGDLQTARQAERQAQKELTSLSREFQQLQESYEVAKQASDELAVAKMRLKYLENVEKENSQVKERLSQLKKENEELEAVKKETSNMVDVMKELADLNTKLQQHQEMDKDLLHQASAEVAMLRAQLELAKEGGHPRVSSDSEQPRESIVSEIERRVAQDMQLQARQAELSSRSEQLQRMQQTLPPGKRSNANRLSMPDVEHLMQQNGVKSLPTSETSTPTVPSAVFEFKQENTSSLPALPPKVPKAPGNSNSIRARAIMGSLLDRPKRRVSSKNTTTTTTSTIALSGNSDISNDTRRRSQSVHLSSPSTIRDALKVPLSADDSALLRSSKSITFSSAPTSAPGSAKTSRPTTPTLLDSSGGKLVPLRGEDDDNSPLATRQRKRPRPASRVFTSAEAAQSFGDDPKALPPSLLRMDHAQSTDSTESVYAAQLGSPTLVSLPSAVQHLSRRSVLLHSADPNEHTDVASPTNPTSSGPVELGVLSSPDASANNSSPALVSSQEEAVPVGTADKMDKISAAATPFKWDVPDGDLRLRLSDLTLQAEHLWVRLTSTDLVKLNRSLRRGFDIASLNTISNTLIDNILTDVIELSAQFTDLPNVNMVQHLLWDNAQLRKTLNDYSLTYVQRVSRASEQELSYKQERRLNSSPPIVASLRRPTLVGGSAAAGRIGAGGINGDPGPHGGGGAEEHDPNGQCVIF